MSATKHLFTKGRNFQRDYLLLKCFYSFLTTIVASFKGTRSMLRTYLLNMQRKIDLSKIKNVETELIKVLISIHGKVY